VLDAPVRRGERPSSRPARAFKARLVAAVLVLVSLALITVHFRESSDGPLHTAQRIGVSVLTPFAVAGERVARPFRDAWSYTSDLIQEQTAARDNERLRELLAFVDGPSFPADFRGVATRVIARPPSVYRQEVLVAAGSGSGVEVNDPVVSDDGLVGLVTDVTSNSAKVTLVTDQQSAVSALVLESDAAGVVRHGASAASLILDRVGKDELVGEGDLVVTAGWKTLRFESLYPPGIPIGTVKSVGQQDVDLYKRIQVTPLVDFDSLSEVIVLVRAEEDKAAAGAATKPKKKK
jgi:rod shape-determining protein MreC